MPLRRRLRTTAASLVLSGCVVLAAHEHPAHADETPAANVEEARRHFEKARADYGQGAYRDALAELQAAHQLDPNAKDLVFNLGVVEEKLAAIDDALTWFHAYTTMSLTPQERERADAYVRRLEGAKKELDARQAASASPATPVTTPEASVSVSAPASATGPTYGRLDAATITAGSVALGALVFGIVVGIKAKSDEPTGFETGVDGSYETLQSRASSAHREAVIADIGFATALAGGITAATLYFARARPASDPSGLAAAVSDATRVSATLVSSGGALVVRGSW
jgi:hypothetical protein